MMHSKNSTALLTAALLGMSISTASVAQDDTDAVAAGNETREQKALPEEAAEVGDENSRDGLDTASEARDRGREFGKERAEEARERRNSAREAARDGRAAARDDRKQRQ